MKNNRPIIYFTNGSIGDFLMSLYFVDLITARPLGSSSVSLDPAFAGHRETPTSPMAALNMPNTRIITPRNESLFKELAVQYPVIVTECNSRTIHGLFNCFMLLPSMLRSNIVVIPLPLESVSFGTRMFAKALSSFPGSNLIGFENNDGKTLYPDMIASLAAKLGFADDLNAHERPRLRFKKDQAILSKYGLIKGEYVILHPCGSNAARTLSADEMISIIRLIHEKSPSLKVVLTGSRKDRAYIEASISGASQINGVSRLSEFIVNLAGKLSMNELANVIEGSRLFIGVDTGITHVACMLNVKSLVISHAASLLQWLPYYDPNARIIYNVNDCQHDINEGLEHLKRCYGEESRYLLHVPIEIVLKALSESLGQKRNMG